MKDPDYPYRVTEPGDPYFTIRCYICRKIIRLTDTVCELRDVENDSQRYVAHAECAKSREISIQ